INAIGNQLQLTKQFRQSFADVFGLAPRRSAAFTRLQFFATIDFPPSFQRRLGVIDEAASRIEVTPRPFQQATKHAFSLFAPLQSWASHLTKRQWAGGSIFVGFGRKGR